MNGLIKLDEIFDDKFFPELSIRNFLKNDDFFTPIHEAKIGYPMDIYDTDSAKIFEIVVLDAEKEDVDVSTKGSVLTIQYDKALKEDEDEKSYECRRITRRAFAFSWKIPDLYCLNKASVRLKNGVLKITIPKEEKEKLKNKKLEIWVDDTDPNENVEPEVKSKTKEKVNEEE